MPNSQPAPVDLKARCQACLHLRLTKLASHHVSGVWDKGTMLFKMLQVILSAASVEELFDLLKSTHLAPARDSLMILYLLAQNSLAHLPIFPTETYFLSIKGRCSSKCI